MKKINGYDEVQESGSFKRLPAGAYIVRILDATDVPDKEYLKISFDIAEGEHKGFFSEQFKNDTREGKKWPASGSFIRSYKEKALPMLKGFTGSVERSNTGYVWNFDEKTLKNKLVGLVLGDEEFVNSSGKVRTRTYVASVRSVDSIKKGDFDVPEVKKLDPSKLTANQPAASAPIVNPFDDSEPVTPAPDFNDNPFVDTDDNPWS